MTSSGSSCRLAITFLFLVHSLGHPSGDDILSPQPPAPPLPSLLSHLLTLLPTSLRKLKLSEKNCHSRTPPLLPTHRHLLHRQCFPPFFYRWTLSLHKTSLSTCTMDSTQGYGANNPPPLSQVSKFPSLLDYFCWHVISPIFKKQINIIKI